MPELPTRYGAHYAEQPFELLVGELALALLALKQAIVGALEAAKQFE